MKIRIYFEDTDCGQIVYHTNYIKYGERARSQAFFDAKIHPYVGDAGFVLKNINATYISPARLGDILEVKTSVLEVKNASCKVRQDIYKIYEDMTHSDCNIAVFSMDIIVAFVDTKSGILKKIPNDMKELLLNIK